MYGKFVDSWLTKFLNMNFKSDCGACYSGKFS